MPLDINYQNGNLPRMLNFKSWFQALPPDQREKFADIAGTTANYVNAHLVHARKMPRPKLLQGLTDACVAMDAPFGRADLVAFFYALPVEEASTAEAQRQAA